MLQTNRTDNGHTSRKYEISKENNLRKIKGKTRKIGHSTGLTSGLFSMSSKQILCQTIIMLVDFSYHPQIHGWGWISFHLKKENAWDIILST